MFILFKIFHDIAFFTWDVSLSVINLVTPNRREGHVTPKGHLGFEGHWPEFVPPAEGDSRCSCPALNAMANHGESSLVLHITLQGFLIVHLLGILPHDGKNIQFKEMGRLIRATYNFSPSFCYFVPNFAAKMLKKDYNKGTFDLQELDLHNGIEHDASLCRKSSISHSFFPS